MRSSSACSLARVLLSKGLGSNNMGALQQISTSAASAAQVESLAVSSSNDAPLLVQLPERTWGPRAQLPSEYASSFSQKKLAVLREPFLRHDAPASPLASTVAATGADQVAVSSAVREHAGRVVVDEYVAAADGSYKLSSTSTDLLRYLRQQGLTVSLVPDVARAKTFNSVRAAGSGLRQSSNEVLMMAPTAFTFNEQAAQDNSFMTATEKSGAVTQRVLQEYATFYQQLTEVHGVKVHLWEHSMQHNTPDACFPNNWFSTHYAGEGGNSGGSTLVLYPMKCPNRAAERRPEIIDTLKARGYSRVVDMSGAEGGSKYFEGTGSLVLDRVNGVAYVGLSERADEALARRWAEQLGYQELVTFRPFDGRGKPVYHTNVVMCVGTDVAVVCGESVRDEAERRHLMASLRRHHAVVDISCAQMDALAGNMLEVQTGTGVPLLVMSQQAKDSLRPDQLALIKGHVADIIHPDISTLEAIGGGGVRCCIAELF